MPIHREGEFLVSYDLQNTPTIYLESSSLAAGVAEARRRRIPGIGGSSGFDFHETNLDFLRELPWVERVWFWDVALENVDGLYALENLRSFGLYHRPGIDFARFPRLESVVWYHDPRDVNVHQLPAAKQLHLWHFKPRSKHFGSVQLPTGLEELDLTWANPRTLEGLPTFPRLRTLEIHRCRNLTSLAGLPAIAPNLERLIITSSGRVTDVDHVREMPRLRVALHDGRSLLPTQAA